MNYYLCATCNDEPSCGTASYDEDTKGLATPYPITHSGDGSLEVGILPDSVVFGHTTKSSFKPLPIIIETSVDVSSVNSNQSAAATTVSFCSSGSEYSLGVSSDSSSKSCITASSTDSIEQSRCTSPDSVERTRSVTFRGPRRPRSINATPTSLLSYATPITQLTLSSSTLSTSRPISPLDGGNCHLATSKMFTNKDLDEITELQVLTYLTYDERKMISANIMGSNLRMGYKLSKGVCSACNMPKLLDGSGESVESCAICPVLKKCVLRKILDGAAVTTSIQSSFDNAAGSIDQLTFDDLSLATADMSRADENDLAIMLARADSESDAQRLDVSAYESDQHSPSSSESVVSASGSNNTSSTTPDDRSAVVDNTFISLLEQFNRTKEKMRESEDVNQMQRSELLAKLDDAAASLNKVLYEVQV